MRLERLAAQEPVHAEKGRGKHEGGEAEKTQRTHGTPVATCPAWRGDRLDTEYLRMKALSACNFRPSARADCAQWFRLCY
jgi:hypothetical protein